MKHLIDNSAKPQPDLTKPLVHIYKHVPDEPGEVELQHNCVETLCFRFRTPRDLATPTRMPTCKECVAVLLSRIAVLQDTNPNRLAALSALLPEPD